MPGPQSIDNAFMPCKIFYEANGLYAKFTGVLTPEDFVVMTNAMQSPVCSDYRYRIADFLDVSEVRVNKVHVVYISDLEYWFDLTCPELVRVVVAKLPEIVEAFNRELPNRSRPESSALFSTLDDARRWVDLRTTES